MTSSVEQGRSLGDLGIEGARLYWNLSEPVLYEEAIRRREASVAAEGPLVCHTGVHTGRSPNDKFFVKEPSSDGHIAWGGPNRPMSAEHFELLRRDLCASLKGAELFVQECCSGADPEFGLPVRVVSEYAWHSLFARNLLLPLPSGDGLTPEQPLTIVDAPSFRADPTRHGTNSDVVVALHLGQRLVLIGGTSYAGEIKKSVFTTLNYLLPLRNVLPMHCSANVGSGHDVALFFGLSGTGKTTLSSDTTRGLIGDDEHGWSDRGVFNFEGGCYAKTIRLSAEAEPQIHAASHRFGTVLENVFIDPDTHRMNLDDDRYTENTRAAYPISFIDNAVRSGQTGHPRTILMLTADAFGVLPPIARLSPEGAMYHFLSGYTAKVAGTEKGVTEPKVTFSSCFGAPFLPLAPSRYAEMLGERIERHRAQVWLVNTGWTGGPYGTGTRMRIQATRAMVAAALSGQLETVAFKRDPVFNVDVPTACPGVEPSVLTPRATWPDPARYDTQACKLARMFVENFATFEPHVTRAVAGAGPRA